jgi:predicted ATPase
MKRPLTESKPTTTNGPRTNIPAVLTSFIRRKREIAEIPQLLASTHLVNLVGAGGCGKTRLALRVAAELTDQYIDGVYCVEFARLTDSALVPQAVAKVLNIVEQSRTLLKDTLLDLLGDRQILLVLECAIVFEKFSD